MPGRVLRRAILGCLALAVAAAGAAAPAPAQDVGELLRGAAATLDGGFGTAFLSPEPPPADDRRGVSAPMPRMLSRTDVRRYREIFRLQDEGKLRAADRLIRALEDRMLMGHVLAQRLLHPTAYKSTWRDLRGWLALYADHPDADRIHRLAMKRKPAGAPEPNAPARGYLGGSGADAVIDVILYVSPRQRGAAEHEAIRGLKRELRRLVQSGRPDAALGRLSRRDARDLLDPVEFADQRGKIALGYFTQGEDEEALRLAAASAREAGELVPWVRWTAGLAAWRLGRSAEAVEHFQSVAMAERASRTLRSAGAYWASRGHLQLGQPGEATRWLARAAQFPLTFYGLLGRQALGVEVPFDWALPRLTVARLTALAVHDGGRRAFALLQVGQSERAEREWRKLFPRLDESLREPLMSIAAQNDMPGLAIRLAGILRVSTGRTYHAALFPLPSWIPQSGFAIDRALIYGIIRQESGFDRHARSARGARGLMQLMPRTASFVDEDDDLDRRHELYVPELNIALGQRYLAHLLDLDKVEGDMFRLLAAYNAGPGNLGRWTRNVDYRDDPLLFIESIPSPETREYIEKVLANVWVYRFRLGQKAPSLERVAAGDWPRYESANPASGPVVKDARY